MKLPWKAKGIVLFEMLDEIMEVLEADEMHIGCAEVFNLGITLNNVKRQGGFRCNFLRYKKAR